MLATETHDCTLLAIRQMPTPDCLQWMHVNARLPHASCHTGASPRCRSEHPAGRASDSRASWEDALRHQSPAAAPCAVQRQIRGGLTGAPSIHTASCIQQNANSCCTQVSRLLETSRLGQLARPHPDTILEWLRTVPACLWANMMQLHGTLVLPVQLSPRIGPTSMSQEVPRVVNPAGGYSRMASLSTAEV